MTQITRAKSFDGKRLILLFAVVFLASCSDLPRDPKNTLRRIENEKKMRVGLVENPPWVVRGSGGAPAGAEVELIKEFADAHGAQPEWHWGGEQALLETLERFELDLVAGGFHDKTPWSKQIGLTSPFFENRIMVGVPASLAPPEDLKGLQVATKNGEATAAFLEKKDAVPVRVENFSGINQMPVAAPEWELEKLGLVVTKIELNKESHIMAAPPGENALIKRLDEFLSSRKTQVKSLLQQNAEEEKARK
ncbi:MAG TPA: transporter substrate-binding domain-containing protein [Pyrinomonadaceae bacterium]|jgi:ABC-type amino acid transport substrate-binding protein